MYSFPELLRKIRNEAGLTQAEFANAIKVSPVLIAMIESGQKDVSKNLVRKIAEAMEVHPASITPFLFGHELTSDDKLSAVEKQFLAWGAKLQDHLIKDRSKLLRRHVK